MTTPTSNLGFFTVGERPAPLQYTFQDANGTVIDLTGYTATCTIMERDGTPLTRAATIPGPATNGVVEYVWQGDEFPTAGHYQVQFWVGNGTNRYASIVIEFDAATAVGYVVPTV